MKYGNTVYRKENMYIFTTQLLKQIAYIADVLNQSSFVSSILRQRDLQKARQASWVYFCWVNFTGFGRSLLMLGDVFFWV